MDPRLMYRKARELGIGHGYGLAICSASEAKTDYTTNQQLREKNKK